MTKCTFHKFGTSREVEKHDALCILPLNIVNEKIYIFLWFWLLLLGCLSTLVVVYRLGKTCYEVCNGIQLTLCYSDSCVASHEGLPSLHKIPVDKERSCQHPCKEKQNGGLVPVLHVRAGAKILPE